jgi:hypothetical protein
MKTVLSTIEEQTGWPGFFMIGDPSPKLGGKIEFLTSVLFLFLLFLAWAIS